MKVLTCNFNLYDLHQSIFLVNQEEDTVTKLCICSLDEIGNHMAQLASQFDVNNIHLYGNKDYAESIINTIRQSNYNSNDLRIEVN